MFRLLIRIIIWLIRFLFKSEHDLRIENLALRQQLAVFKDKRPRPKIQDPDQAFWVALRSAWPIWTNALILVKPDTVTKWHRRDFRLFWRWKSKTRKSGRPRISREIRDLILKMARENGWGAPRIHGELLKLGFDVDERTVSRYLPKRPSPPDALKNWLAFLKNHREVITGADFFTVPNATFQVLYVFFVIRHDRRKIVHFAITSHPYAEWVVQQLREAFPFDTAPRYLILDRDGKYGDLVPRALKSWGIKPVRTSFRSPWQNGVAERWVLSARRELLDHVVVLNDSHLHRLPSEYIRYYHEDRCHLTLEKDTPSGRPVEHRPSPSSRVVCLPRVGGLHHRYRWKDAA
jgi:putative transposase